MKITRSQDLRDRVKGAVYVPGDEGYDGARQGWNLAIVQHPLVVVDAIDAEDVQAAVRFAKNAGLPIGVMTTGHGLPRGCDKGVLILTRQMSSVAVDPKTRIAKIGGGAQFKHVFAVAQPHGLAPLSGSAPHVGVVGYTLGGGFGLMIRKHGLAIDSVRGATIVTPEGELVRATDKENTDLFWAIRGGGGAFGVIVEIEMELVPQPMVYGGATIYPAENVEEIYNAYAKWTADLPEEVSSCIQLMNLPPLPIVPEPLRGKAVININACVCGDLQNAQAHVQPMRELGQPILDMWGEFPYAESARVYNDPIDPLPATGRGVLLTEMTPQMISRLLGAIGPVERSPQVNIQLRHLGGAMARVAHDETPVGCRREAKYLIYFLGVPNPFVPAEAMREHANHVIDAIAPHTLCRGPLNFVGEGDVEAASVRAVFNQPSFERLTSIKRSIDPENRFRFSSVGLA
ncbi:FAD-binding oxidoreductase [Fimbriimonas ginsengisoli]|nr:FAD-binding oxidoreductase [Fimbriimonas ginsengisoli]